MQSTAQKISFQLLKEGRDYSERVLNGLRAGVSHFHAVQYMKDQLAQNGFNELSEVDKWNLQAGQSYFFTRNKTTIVAFTLGQQCQEKGVDLFKIVGCHTDSPVIKLAPHTKVANKHGFQQLNIQSYGGGLWRTWFDRDLGLAGRVVIKDAENRLTSKLWDSKKALMNIPSLCIHLDRSDEFKPNKEQHLKPILATHIVDQLMVEGIQPFKDQPDVFNVEQKHFLTFLDMVARDIEVKVDQIVDFEFAAYDFHKPAIIGIHDEFVASPRLDNLASSLCSLDSLIDYHKNADKNNSECSMIMLFDHEEIGSCSA